MAAKRAVKRNQQPNTEQRAHLGGGSDRRSVGWICSEARKGEIKVCGLISKLALYERFGRKQVPVVAGAAVGYQEGEI